MTSALHITSGDMAGSRLAASGVPGEVFVWHDILYDGPRRPGWPDEDTVQARTDFLFRETGGGLSRDDIESTVKQQYDRLAAAGDAEEHIVLWFDACLFDQSMLAHILACMHERRICDADLLCVDAFPGIEPYNGVGQLEPTQMASVYDRRLPVCDSQFQFAVEVDAAFAAHDVDAFTQIAAMKDPPLPWMPAAARRWLAEQPDPATGLGRLESLALTAVRAGCEKPADI